MPLSRVQYAPGKDSAPKILFSGVLSHLFGVLLGKFNAFYLVVCYRFLSVSLGFGTELLCLSWQKKILHKEKYLFVQNFQLQPIRFLYNTSGFFSQTYWIHIYSLLLIPAQTMIHDTTPIYLDPRISIPHRGLSCRDKDLGDEDWADDLRLKTYFLALQTHLHHHISLRRLSPLQSSLPLLTLRLCCRE